MHDSNLSSIAAKLFEHGAAPVDSGSILLLAFLGACRCRFLLGHSRDEATLIRGSCASLALLNFVGCVLFKARKSGKSGIAAAGPWNHMRMLSLQSRLVASRLTVHGWQLCVCVCVLADVRRFTRSAADVCLPSNIDWLYSMLLSHMLMYQTLPLLHHLQVL
jgi:hypothetical protein